MLIGLALPPLSACAPLPVPADADMACATPVGAGWPVSPPVSEGFDAAALCGALQRFAASGRNLHGLLVERRGHLVAEVYRSGPDNPIDERYGIGNPFRAVTPFALDTRHDVRSVSKTVVGLLVGIELARGRFPALDTPLLELYPELSDLRADGRERITVRHLLTMTDGLAWREMGRGPLRSDETGLFVTRSQPRYVLDRPVEAAPGSRFNYNGGATTLLADLLVRASGKPFRQIVRDDLMDPMGIADWHWAVDPRGRELPFAGLQMRPRDLLKLGRMVLDGGRWQGQQVVPETWLAESMRTFHPAPATALQLDHEAVGYGMHWWTGDVRWQGRTLHWASAIGNGGQRLLLVPALDLAVVVVAGHYGEAGIQSEVSEVLHSVLVSVASA